MTTTTATSSLSSFPGRARTKRGAPPPIRVVLESARDKWQHAVARYDRLLAGSRSEYRIEFRSPCDGPSSTSRDLSFSNWWSKRAWRSVVHIVFPRWWIAVLRLWLPSLLPIAYLRHHISCCWIIVAAIINIARSFQIIRYFGTSEKFRDFRSPFANIHAIW